LLNGSSFFNGLRFSNFFLLLLFGFLSLFNRFVSLLLSSWFFNLLFCSRFLSLFLYSGFFDLIFNNRLFNLFLLGFLLDRLICFLVLFGLSFFDGLLGYLTLTFCGGFCLNFRSGGSG
jgi:hypothetical protein